MANQKPAIYKRKDKVWAWGYYIPPCKGLKRGQYGRFVCATKEEAQRGIDKPR
jgi:hypothetical protein